MATRQDAEPQRVRVGDGALPLPRGEHWRRQRFGERAEPGGALRRAATEPGDEHGPRRGGEELCGGIEGARHGRRQRLGTARGRDGHRRGAGDVRRDVEVHRAARRRHRELRGVGDPVGRRGRFHAEARLAREQGGRVVVGQEDQRRAVERRVGDARDRRGDARPRAGERSARRAREVARHGRHHARRGVAIGEDEREVVGTHRLEEPDVGGNARHAEEPGRARALEPVDDDVRDCLHEGASLSAGPGSRTRGASARGPM